MSIFKKKLHAKTSQELSNFVNYLRRNGFLLKIIKNKELINNYYNKKKEITINDKPKKKSTTEDQSEPDITIEDQSEPDITTEDQRREQPEEPTEEQMEINKRLERWKTESQTRIPQTSITEVTQEHMQKAIKIELENNIKFFKNELDKNIKTFTDLQTNNKKIFLNYTGNNVNIKALIVNIKALIENIKALIENFNNAKSQPNTLENLKKLEDINSKMTKSLSDLNNLLNLIKEPSPIGGGKPTKYKSTGITVFILYKNKKYNRTIYVKEKGKTKYCKIKNEYILLSKLKVIG